MTRTPDAAALPREIVRLADLTNRSERTFALAPEAPGRAAVAADLGVSEVRKLRFEGRLVPAGRSDWRLEGTLGATVVQPCVVTFAPVVTRIDEPVVRTYVAQMPEVEGLEVEMPEDDSLDPLPSALDLGAVLLEALSLAIPAWPRAEGVAEVDLTVAAPGVVPLDAEAARPFAGLADLKARLGGGAGEGDDGARDDAHDGDEDRDDDGGDAGA